MEMKTDLEWEDVVLQHCHSRA